MRVCDTLMIYSFTSNNFNERDFDKIMKKIKLQALKSTRSDDVKQNKEKTCCSCGRVVQMTRCHVSPLSQRP